MRGSTHQSNLLVLVSAYNKGDAMERGHFDWRSLGKADYAQAHALVAGLPSELRSQIAGVSNEILARLVHLMWYRAEHSGRGSAYCWPGLATLGRYCLRSVRTVQRHVVELVEAGLLTTKERFRENGLNTSSLYFPGPCLLASLFARHWKKKPMKWHTTKMSANDLKREYKADAPSDMGVKATGTEEKLREHRPHLASRHAVVFEPRHEMSKEEIDARKALLRQQAEYLKARGL